MRALLILGLVILLGACSSTPRYSSNYGNYSYSNAYVAPAKPQYQASSYQAKTYSAPVNNSYSAQRPIQKVSSVPPPVTVSNFERLSYEDLVRFEPDCEQRVEQTALLEEQLKRNRFYTVDGVEGNTYPGKISKSYYSLAKYRIWALRFACQGSEVSRDLIKADLQASPNQPPSAMPRCYFEETVEAKTGYQQTQYLTSDHKSTRREICTNFPYAQERPFIRVGEQMSLSPRDIKDGASHSALRKWKGNIYQLVSKTEMHLNQAVRFTLVTVRSGVNQWTVVDKF
ncbi:hypothetical protein [Polynucleobacter sp. Adler-ghost]|uniref:hypothetical protein n=1 Tax=Polynucleobacter sp. Adler-ghost TaxID=2770234 RepID=UPI001BFDC0A6|nr:hypothetical protein [Polynucleobacter sp. Adler-ghost]QWE29944.1 hypothetical protein ICV89_06460 [Polynucleobacter sp. Adler-ghost]